MAEALEAQLSMAPFHIAYARQVLTDLAEIYEQEPVFAPILFIHVAPQDARRGTPTMRLMSLADVEQEDWPAHIQQAVDAAGAELWSLATEVSMRFYEPPVVEKRLLRSEEWLVYLMCHQGGMVLWGAPIFAGRKLGSFRELTDDSRLQRLLAHLSQVNTSPGN